jgi:chaperonin cofactor prefoldin
MEINRALSREINHLEIRIDSLEAMVKKQAESIKNLENELTNFVNALQSGSSGYY